MNTKPLNSYWFAHFFPYNPVAAVPLNLYENFNQFLCEFLSNRTKVVYFIYGNTESRRFHIIKENPVEGTSARVLHGRVIVRYYKYKTLCKRRKFQFSIGKYCQYVYFVWGLRSFVSIRSEYIPSIFTRSSVHFVVILTHQRNIIASGMVLGYS